MSSIFGVYAVPDEMRCKYPSKRCESARVLKRDGDFHRFCEFHRVKANLNQQRLEQRRRASPRAQSPTQRRTKRSAPCKPAAAACEQAASPTTFCDPDEFGLPPIEMDDLDLHLLRDLLEAPHIHHYDVSMADDTHAALRLLDAEPSYTDAFW